MLTLVGVPYHDLEASFTDNSDLDPPPTFHNYLDDFLQAVRVFGFVRRISIGSTWVNR
jgi:hypothetical protein